MKKKKIFLTVKRTYGDFVTAFIQITLQAKITVSTFFLHDFVFCASVLVFRQDVTQLSLAFFSSHYLRSAGVIGVHHLWCLAGSLSLPYFSWHSTCHLGVYFSCCGGSIFKYECFRTWNLGFFLSSHLSTSSLGVKGPSSGFNQHPNLLAKIESLSVLPSAYLVINSLKYVQGIRSLKHTQGPLKSGSADIELSVRAPWV